MPRLVSTICSIELAPEDGNTITVHVMPLGDVEAVDGRLFRFTPSAIEHVVADARKRKSQMPLLASHGRDPKHGTEAQGWFKEWTVNEGKGLLAGLDLLPETRDAIRRGAWKYLSPGFYAEEAEDGYLVPFRLVEISLTNTPAIDGLDPIAAAAQEVSMPKEKEDGTTQVTLSADETQASLKELIQAETKKLVDAMRKEDATRSAVEKAIAAGKITVAQRDAAIELATSAPEAFSRFVDAAVVVTPVRPVPFL